MIVYVLLGIALLLAVVLLARWFATANTSSVARWLKWAFYGIAGAAALYFAVTGKIQLALIPLALTVLPRILAGFMAQSVRANPSPGNRSDVRTDYLQMELDHDSGEMFGQVLRGAFAGRDLKDLTREELVTLLAECEARDPQSARILETYLDRTAGPEWRDGSAGASAGAGKDGRGEAPPSAASAKMTRDEAYEVLGLKPGASAEAVKEAHRTLMLKLHPDHGGSNYLAAKINQAKDLLLGL